MAGRAETILVILVLAASGLVMLAPLVGRAGAPDLADAVMILAASCGVGAWLLAGAATLRAARRVGRGRRSQSHPEGEGSR